MTTHKRKATAPTEPEQVPNEPKKLDPKIKWASNHMWTFTMINYLTEHPSFRIKFFGGDATKDATEEGRPKIQGKDGKGVMMATLAQHIFEENESPDIASQYKENPARFTASLGSHIQTLKKTYQTHVTSLGATGAGLDPSAVVAGSAEANKFEEIRKSFPFWDDLHGFWRELPSYNPIGISSSYAGQNHASSAAKLFAPMEKEEEDEDDEDKAHADRVLSDDENEAGNQLRLALGDGDKVKPRRSPHFPGGRTANLLAPPVASIPPTPVDTPSASKLSGVRLAGRDFGLAKSGPSSSKKVSPQIESITETRRADISRIAEKRKFENDERMLSLQNQQERERQLLDYKRQKVEAKDRAEARAFEIRKLEMQIQLARAQGGGLPGAGFNLLGSNPVPSYAHIHSSPSVQSDSFPGTPSSGSGSLELGSGFVPDLSMFSTPQSGDWGEPGPSTA